MCKFLSSLCRSLFLLQLHEDSVTVLGMEEHHWLPVRPDPRLRTQAPNVLSLDVRHGGPYVVDLDADVMDAPGLVLL